MTKLKVGIVTYIKNMNYGSALQAFALQRFLDQANYDSYLIDYLDRDLSHNVQVQNKVILNRLLSGLKTPLRLMELHKAKKCAAPSEEKEAAFEKFENNKMKYSKDDYTQQGSFDAFICGSDQIWSAIVPGLNWRFFLRFAPREKRIAYAPSFGSIEVPRYNKVRLKKYLNDFECLSARELSGARIIYEMTGKNVPVVLDPTLLVGREFWQSEIPQFAPRKIAVCYFLSPTIDYVEEVLAEANERGLDAIWIEGSNALNLPEVKYMAPDPLEFVRMIASSECVFTDSFHGLVFSLLFGKDVSIFDRNYESNPQQSTRIDSLLEMLKLNPIRDVVRHQRRICNYDIESVTNLLSDCQKGSAKYLLTSLERVTKYNSSGY